MKVTFSASNIIFILKLSNFNVVIVKKFLVTTFKAAICSYVVLYIGANTFGLIESFSKKKQK